MASTLLVVESPSKAKTLKKYLGSGFDVLASYGHVRDLVEKQGSVDTDRGFTMKYELVDRNVRHVEAIVKAAARSDRVLLATDPDREGEAIAWHIAEILKSRKAVKKGALKRVVFYEITEGAVQEAVANPRDVEMNLVNAQQARRALDYLVGFSLSPLLWKKIGPGLSAGRVQSPALRLIVEREQEIEAFVPQEYWSIHLDSHKGKQKFGARLFQYRGEKVEQFTVRSEAEHRKILDSLEKATEGKVVRAEKKPRTRSAAPPFITSTLQQEAVRKLGMTAERAMRTAQQLYEGVDIGTGAVGLITYMRTDSVNLANEAVAEIRQYIGKHFDAEYLPKSPVHYRSKVKNAQEAHEAIRPTSIKRAPDQIRGHLTTDQAKLYEMIWKRTLASQMAPARFDTTSVDIAVGRDDTLFRAAGQVLVFPGFIAVYQEGVDDAAEENEEKLPPLAQGDVLPVDRVYGDQHFTQPPPRYSEASLVKALEEHGIGRPSTYASILSTLQSREYAVLEKKRFMPTDIGRLVKSFLTSHFDHYVDYGFTALMEEELDDISNGALDWVAVLGEFWQPFATELQAKAEVGRGCALPAAEPRCESWKDFSLRVMDKAWVEAGRPTESCPQCGKPVVLQNSRKGPFVGCSGYPDCDYTRPWARGMRGGEPTLLGADPESGQEVFLQKGPYGWYVQLGRTEKDAVEKPRRASWPRKVPVEQADLDKALKLLSLPRLVGSHPETGKPIEANLGRFGPYVKHDGLFKSIPKSESIFEITLEKAVQLLAEAKASAARALGTHPEDGKPISVGAGRFGPYVKHLKTYASIPSRIDPAKITLEEALQLLAVKVARASGKEVPPAANEEPATYKAAAKKKPLKKAAAKASAKTAKAAEAKPVRKKKAA